MSTNRVVLLSSPSTDESSPDEKDTLLQADAVSQALSANGFSPYPVAFTIEWEKLRKEIDRNKPVFIFNLVETVMGSRLIHLAPALAEWLNLPCTGGNTENLRITSNKILTKNLLHKAGIPTPPWGVSRNPGSINALLDKTVIVKPVWEDASVGITDKSVGNFPNLQKILAVSPLEMFAEVYVDGREFNLSVIEKDGQPQVLPPAEIRFVNFPENMARIVGYKAKWDPEAFEYINTIRTFTFSSPGDKLLLKKLEELAIQCWELLDLRGYARVDFRVDSSGRPWVLEINANPCLSPDSGFTASALMGDYTYEEMIGVICDAAG
ncbi:MAG: ATP-grasp domain-containing protein [Candidatus Margulisiibacteriota bacterium]